MYAFWLLTCFAKCLLAVVPGDGQLHDVHKRIASKDHAGKRQVSQNADPVASFIAAGVADKRPNPGCAPSTTTVRQPGTTSTVVSTLIRPQSCSVRGPSTVTVTSTSLKTALGDARPYTITRTITTTIITTRNGNGDGNPSTITRTSTVGRTTVTTTIRFGSGPGSTITLTNTGACNGQATVTSVSTTTLGASTTTESTTVTTTEALGAVTTTLTDTITNTITNSATVTDTTTLTESTTITSTTTAAAPGGGGGSVGSNFYIVRGRNEDRVGIIELLVYNPGGSFSDTASFAAGGGTLLTLDAGGIVRITGGTAILVCFAPQEGVPLELRDPGVATNEAVLCTFGGSPATFPELRCSCAGRTIFASLTGVDYLYLTADGNGHLESANSELLVPRAVFV